MTFRSLLTVAALSLAALSVHGQATSQLPIDETISLADDYVKFITKNGGASWQDKRSSWAGIAAAFNAQTATITGKTLDGDLNTFQDLDPLSLKTPVPISKGGTGAATEALARAALGITSRVDVQTFTTPGGTWNKPTGAYWIEVIVVGGGGGGGSGKRRATNLACSGGGGGSSGGQFRSVLRAAAFGTSETITVGAGGTGGAGQTADDTNGNNGTAGGASSIGSLITVVAGNPGLGGADAGTGTAGAAVSCFISEASNGTLSAGGGANGGAGTGSASTGYFYLSSGGGGGGGLDASNNHFNGGLSGTNASGSFNASLTGTVGAAGGGNGTTGPLGPYLWQGNGGPGGGANNAGTGGDGGDANGYGAGGGGGGASRNGSTSGRGGNGSPGVVMIISYISP